jgi:YHS domain-containing protein/Spy/CpxP family protein refolding chaperone
VIALALALAIGFSVYSGVKAEVPGGGCCAADTPAHASAGGGHDMHGSTDKAPMHGSLASELKLTDDQKARMDAIWTAFRERGEPIHADIKAKRAALRELLSAPQPDRARVKSAVDQLTGLYGRMAGVGVDKLLEAKKILTPEQNAILVDRLDKCPMFIHGMASCMMGDMQNCPMKDTCPMMGGGSTEPTSGGHHEATVAPAAPAKAIDPVCNMEIATASAVGKSVYGNKTYYFCNPGCKARFDKSPENYTK